MNEEKTKTQMCASVFASVPDFALAFLHQQQLNSISWNKLPEGGIFLLIKGENTSEMDSLRVVSAHTSLREALLHNKSLSAEPGTFFSSEASVTWVKNDLTVQRVAGTWTEPVSVWQVIAASSDMIELPELPEHRGRAFAMPGWTIEPFSSPQKASDIAREEADDFE